MKYTLSQQEAIYSDADRLLVTASAGCGKTTVMIERIAQLIASKQTTIDNIVVVTFTNYAAQEMKNRLVKKLWEYSDDKDIREQIGRVENSAVSTVHSFCLQLLKNYFYVLGLDPAFAVLDKSTKSTYITRVLDEVIKEYCERDDQQFDKLYKIMCLNRKEDNLREQIVKLYEFSVCFADFDAFYDKTRRAYSFDEDSAFYRLICEDYVTACNGFADTLDDCAVQALKYGAKELAQYCSVQAATYRMAVNASLKAVYMSATQRENGSNLTGKLKAHQGNYACDAEEFDRLVERIKSTRERAKSYVDTYKGLFCAPLTTLIEQSKATLPILDKLIEVVKAFGQKYFVYKKERGYLDFADLEHLTLELLSDAQVYADVKEKYTHIFVDEYQDVNDMQEALINKLSQEAKLFVVGDVKQSIYGFRQCDPDIFASRLDRAKGDKDVKTVTLANNYRSDKCILDAVNDIFSRCMTKSFGNVDYANDSMLMGDRHFDLWEQKVAIVEAQEPDCDKTPYSYDGKVYDIATSSQGLASNRGLSEAHAVVRVIKSLVGTQKEFFEKGQKVRRAVRYSDIAILSRKVQAEAETLYNTLLAENIPVSVSLIDKFGTKELGDLLNFLRVLDNPYDDVAVIGLALSFIGQLDKEQLAVIASNTDAKCMYKRFIQYSENNQDEIADKINSLLALTQRYRTMSYYDSVDKLLCSLLRETEYDLYVLTLPNGSVRSNRMYGVIADMQDKPYSLSVSKYLQQIEQYEQEREIEQLYTEGVLLTSMHKSKGLEFPIVIGVGLCSKLKADSDTVIRSGKVGLAMDYYDFENKTKTLSLSRFAIRLSNQYRVREEDLRLLYVLTTRAVCALYLIRAQDTEPVAPRYSKVLYEYIAYADAYRPIAVFSGQDATVKTLDALPTQEKDDGSIARNLAFVYASRDVPTKVTASGLKRIADQESDEAEKEAQDLLRVTTPDQESASEELIMDQKQIDEESKLRPDYASLGTAYHKLCEHVSLRCTAIEVQNKLDDLVDRGLIDSVSASAIDVNCVVNTFASPQLARIIKGKTYHEIPFMVKLPFSSLVAVANNQETVLQGVIDLLVCDGERATVLDFKYTQNPQYIKKNYQLQMNAYVLATKQILGVRDVDAYIVSIADGRVVKMV